jgi:hypothetical protein
MNNDLSRNQVPDYDLDWVSIHYAFATQEDSPVINPEALSLTAEDLTYFEKPEMKMFFNQLMSGAFTNADIVPVPTKKKKMCNKKRKTNKRQ